MSKHDRLVWIDLEMTGLDPDHHVVVEVAALVTDADLNVLGQGVDIVVHATEEQLAGMNGVRGGHARLVGPDGGDSYLDHHD